MAKIAISLALSNPNCQQFYLTSVGSSIYAKQAHHVLFRYSYYTPFIGDLKSTAESDSDDEYVTLFISLSNTDIDFN